MKINLSSQSHKLLRGKPLQAIGVIAVFSVTFFGIAILMEGSARLIFPSNMTNTCSVYTGDNLIFKPSCTSKPLKFWEGPWFTYSTNECGYRSNSSCRRRPPGDLRVAVLGTSMSDGFGVAQPDTFSTQAEAALRARCSAPVDFQNLALGGAAIGARPQWHKVLRKMPEALGLQPDAIVMTISALDLKYYKAPPNAPGSTPGTDRPRPSIGGLISQWKMTIATSASAMALRSVMFRDGKIYLAHYLQEGDDAAFLYGEFSPAWRMRMGIASSVLGPMAEQAKSAHIPFFVIYYPTYPQAIAATLPTFAPGFDPMAIDAKLGAIVRAHGGIFVDMTPEVSKRQNLPSIYYVSNDHPNGAGNKIIADKVVRLLETNLPAFKACRGS